jgi:hypothetical protein
MALLTDALRGRPSDGVCVCMCVYEFFRTYDARNHVCCAIDRVSADCCCGCCNTQHTALHQAGVRVPRCSKRPPPTGDGRYGRLPYSETSGRGCICGWTQRPHRLR